MWHGFITNNDFEMSKLMTDFWFERMTPNEGEREREINGLLHENSQISNYNRTWSPEAHKKWEEKRKM